jgi:AraC family transcriptional regulator
LEALRKIVWEQEATLLTFALDPTLLAGVADERLPRITGELRWAPCQAQPASFILPVHPILLVHLFHETCPAEHVEIVPNLREHDPLLHHIALVLQAEIEGKGVHERLYVETLVDALATHFLRRYRSSRRSPQEVTGGLSLYKLRRTTSYIRDHLEQDLSLVTLASVGEMSPTHFARLFKHATGLTPHHYVIACRMERAKLLLAETAETLIDIGLQVGCADQSHFTALFHKHVGLTPKAYREHTKSEIY